MGCLTLYASQSIDAISLEYSLFIMLYLGSIGMDYVISKYFYVIKGQF